MHNKIMRFRKTFVLWQGGVGMKHEHNRREYFENDEIYSTRSRRESILNTYKNVNKDNSQLNRWMPHRKGTRLRPKKSGECYLKGHEADGAERGSGSLAFWDCFREF